MQIRLCKLYSTARNREEKPCGNLGQRISPPPANSCGAWELDELIHWSALHCSYRGCWGDRVQVHAGGKAVLAGSWEASVWPADWAAAFVLSADRFGVLSGFGRGLPYHLGVRRETQDKHLVWRSLQVHAEGKRPLFCCGGEVTGQAAAEVRNIHLLWDVSVPGTWKPLSVEYQPADSKFPTSALIRKKCVCDYS